MAERVLKGEPVFLFSVFNGKKDIPSVQSQEKPDHLWPDEFGVVACRQKSRTVF